MEETLARHRKEKRDLQARITQKKKNATKKTRKGVTEECERLERELAETHQAELGKSQPDGGHQLVEEVAELVITVPEDKVNGETQPGTADTKSEAAPDSMSADQHRTRKPNRQRARLARRAAEQEAQVAAAEEEAENMPDQREQELAAMKAQMEKLGLSEIQIQPDGHCLFSACAHSLPPDLLAPQASEVKQQPYQKVRQAAADFMAEHPDDFEAFMEESLASYARKIRDTAEWGGQLELQAISRSYKVGINVLRANGQIEKISPGLDGDERQDPIWLAYYQHSFGLGEHYNALRTKNER
jgi:OTU domain-containing protein 6